MAAAREPTSPESHSYVEMRETLGFRLGKTYKDMVDTLGRELSKGDICRCKYKQVRKRLKELAADKDMLLQPPQLSPVPSPSLTSKLNKTEPKRFEVENENKRFKRGGLKLDIKKAQDWGRSEQLERSKAADILNSSSVDVDDASGNDLETEPSNPHAPSRRHKLRPRVIESPDITRAGSNGNDADAENEYDPCK